jgi:hypothetical protein
VYQRRVVDDWPRCQFSDCGPPGSGTPDYLYARERRRLPLFADSKPASKPRDHINAGAPGALGSKRETVAGPGLPPLRWAGGVVPKRVLDGDAMWTSRKLKLVEPEWARGEFANLLPLALANGVFELDVDQIHARAYAYLRPTISREDVTTALTAFERVGLLFRFQDESGKAWGYWIGIDKPGRLPSLKRQKGRHERTGPEPPRDLLEQYLREVNQWSANGRPLASLGFGSGFGFGLGSGSGKKSCASHTPSRPAAAVRASGPQRSEPQPEGEQPAQPQPESQRREEGPAVVPHPVEPTKEGQGKPEQLELGQAREEKPTAKVLLEIYEQERGPLPAVRDETPERLSKCRKRLLSHGKSQEKFLADFRAAVRKASQLTWPGWRPGFDWFVENDTHYIKVLEGAYDNWGNNPARSGTTNLDEEIMRVAATAGRRPN